MLKKSWFQGFAGQTGEGKSVAFFCWSQGRRVFGVGQWNQIRAVTTWCKGYCDG
jgi:hypothetical protein